MTGIRRAGHDRRIVAAAPFGPGAVIELVVGMAERFQRQRDDRGGDAGAAGGDDRLDEIDAGILDRLRSSGSDLNWP